MIRVPPKKFCAHCIDATSMLTLSTWNGRLVWLCGDCRDPAKALAMMAPDPNGELTMGGVRIRRAPRAP